MTNQDTDTIIHLMSEQDNKLVDIKASLDALHGKIDALLNRPTHIEANEKTGRKSVQHPDRHQWYDKFEELLMPLGQGDSAEISIAGDDAEIHRVRGLLYDWAKTKSLFFRTMAFRGRGLIASCSTSAIADKKKANRAAKTKKKAAK